MEFYRKSSIAVLVPMVLMLALYGVSSISALSTPEASRFLQNENNTDMLALMAKCTCVEGDIFCSDTEALSRCKCDGLDDNSMVICEEEVVVEEVVEEEFVEEVVEEDDHGHDHGSHHGHGSHEMEEEEEDRKPWGIVIFVSFIINLTTLTGVFVVGGHWFRNMLCPGYNPDPSVGRLWANVIIPMFASGALMSTTFFLLLPEALFIIRKGLAGAIEEDDSDGHDHRQRLLGGSHGSGDGPYVDEVLVTWRWGASILGGFLFPVFLHALFPQDGHGDHHHHHHDDESPNNSNTEANNDESTDIVKVADTDNDAELAKTNGKISTTKTEQGSNDTASDEDEYITICFVRLKNLPLFLSFNLGEALHNFTDGLFVGAAYMGCGRTMGHSVAIATVVHEIPNQLAGYLVMVHQNGIHPITALVVNFIFGMIVLIGALVVLVATPGDVAVGSIFAIGGGIFIHVAIYEMLGTAERSIEKQHWWLYVFLSFFVGAICIGLVLINHTHC